MTDRTAYGGQAVVEGVMIRGKDRVATAVRRPDGSIVVQREGVDSWSKGRSWMRLAFVRGTPALIESLRLGYRTLMWSADQATEGDEQIKLSPMQYNLTILGALAFGIGFFVVLPSLVLKLLFHHAGAASSHSSLAMQFIPSVPTFLFCVGEGVLRILMLIGYILVIGRMGDVRRIFAYHGAEHKVVNAYEAGADLTVEACKPYSRIHPRCGTSFLFLVFIVSILVHALIGVPSPVLLVISRLVMLPIVAGVAYELIRLAGRKRDSIILRILVWPGMLLQQLTTAEPADDQIEVAISSLRAVLVDEGVLQPEPEPEAAHPAPALGEPSLAPASS